MCRIVGMSLIVVASLLRAQDLHIPKEAPKSMPARLIPDFELGKSGDVFAMIRTNQWHEGQAAVEVFPKALILNKLEELVKQGNAKAMVKLADHLPPAENGTKEEKNQIQRRRRLLEQAALLGEPSAMNRHAWELWRFDKNKEESVRWWFKGKQLWEGRANRGEPEAIVAMANYGEIPPINADPELRKKSFSAKEKWDWLRLAAEIDRDCAYRYGQLIGVEDYKESIKWTEKAANDGHWLAMIQMARWWARGFPDGVDRKFDPATHPHLVKKTDAAKAWGWLDRAAGLVGWEMVSEQLTEMGTDQFPKRPE